MSSDGSGGWSSGSSSSLPQNLTVDSRSGNQPAEYKASYSIEFTNGFESGDNDEFSAYITTDNGSGGSGGSTGGTGNGSIEDNGRYRYGFNGKEMDDEIKGEGNELDYGLRIYDPRVGRFLSTDPLTSKYPELTPYQYASNRPIDGVDLDGLEWQSNNDQKGRIRNATQSDWDNNPGTAFLKDVSAYLLNWLTPAGAIDDAVETWRNSKSTTREKGQAVMDVLMAPGFPEKPNSGQIHTESPVPATGVHPPERAVVESPSNTQPVNATNKNAASAHNGNPGAAQANAANKPKGTNNPNTRAALNIGNKVHYDPLNGDPALPLGLPTELAAKYPNTQFNFKPRGAKGADVEVIGGTHPSLYPNSNWDPKNNFADFKPNTTSGDKTFNSEVKNGKLPQNTQKLSYDPTTGKLQ